MTAASLIDELDEAKRTITRAGQSPPMVNYNALTISVDELGVLLPEYGREFMSKLVHLWDGYPYSESRRSRKEKPTIEKPILNLLAGAQPGYLRDTIPEGAWDQGFISRTILVYSGESERQSLFNSVHIDPKLKSVLISDLQQIGSDGVYGKVKFTEEAKAVIDNWHLTGAGKGPSHPKLAHWLTRRTEHALRLSLVVSMARSNELVIEADDFTTGLSYLTEAEHYMGDIFKAMTHGGDNQIAMEAWHFATESYLKSNKKPIRQELIVRFLSERTPAHNVMRLLEIMERAGILRREQVKGQGVCFVPSSKGRHY